MLFFNTLCLQCTPCSNSASFFRSTKQKPTTQHTHTALLTTRSFKERPICGKMGIEKDQHFFIFPHFLFPQHLRSNKEPFPVFSFYDEQQDTSLFTFSHPILNEKWNTYPFLFFHLLISKWQSDGCSAPIYNHSRSLEQCVPIFLAEFIHINNCRFSVIITTYGGSDWFYICPVASKGISVHS